MIYAKPGAEFEALLTNAEASGLVGTLAVRIDETDGATALARQTTGINEPVPGNYIAKLIAPTDEGNYLVVFDKAGSKELTPLNVAVEQLQVTRVTPNESVVEFLPDVSDVAVILRARTFDDTSKELGTFTTATRPTAGEVQTSINEAGNEVRARVGQDIEDDASRAFARKLVAIRAAMEVELSYFPEQLETDQSAYDRLEKRYESGLASLIDMLPDTSATQKGLYSLRTRSEIGGTLSTAEQIP